MSGIAALYNPHAPVKKQIHLHYSTNSNNLALEFRDETQVNDTPDIRIAKTGDLVGTIRNPGQITANVLTGAQIVVGFTKKPADTGTGDDTKFNHVSVISPIYYSLDKTELTNLTIASCGAEETVWVYYYKGDSTLELSEVNVKTGGKKSYDTIKVLADSSIAAYYNEKNKKRYMIVQSAKDSKFQEYDNEGSETEIASSGDAKDGCTVAAIYKNDTVYFYYTDRNDKVKVIKKVKGDWGHSDEVDGNPVDSASQMTAVNTGAANHIFYVAEDDPSTIVTHIADNI